MSQLFCKRTPPTDNFRPLIENVLPTLRGRAVLLIHLKECIYLSSQVLGYTAHITREKPKILHSRIFALELLNDLLDKLVEVAVDKRNFLPVANYLHVASAIKGLRAAHDELCGV